LKIPVANFYHLVILETHPGHSRCVAAWNFNCAWFADQTFSKSKSKVYF